MQKTQIAWTNETWNFFRGCTKISPGCKYCYAEGMAKRFQGTPGAYFEGFEPRVIPAQFTEPLRRKKPSMIFVNSMSDFFHEAFDVTYLHEAVEIMRKADWHTYQILTKRSARMRELLSGELRSGGELDHVWWGVSVEDRRYGLPRIDDLRATPAKVRFLSIEPLLEDLGEIDLAGIHWVIVGGESGPNARPMKAEWAESIRQQCEAAGVPFFFKQAGGRGRDKGGYLLNGKIYRQWPEMIERQTSLFPGF